MKIFIFLITFTTLSAATFASGVVLHSFDDVEKYLRTNSSAPMEEIISHLSPELRSNYQLVYESRSAIKGSLEKPRVILYNADKTKIIAFGGDPKLPGGQQMEFMELHPETKKLELKMVDFSGGKALAHSNPETCVACHASQGIKGKKLLRPIWDTYPDWPGVYGSSHNNIMMGRKGRVGVSGIPDLDFEKENFKRFQKSAASDARYRNLIGLNEMTIDRLADAGTVFSDRLIGLNQQSTHSHLQSAIDEIRKNPSLEYRLRKAEELDLIINQYSVPNELKTFKESEIRTLRDQFNHDLSLRNTRQLSHYESKLKRLKKILTDHAKSNHDLNTLSEVVLRDGRSGQLNINQMQTISALNNDPRDASGLRLERLLESLGLDPGASSIAFEPMSAVYKPGNGINVGGKFEYQSDIIEALHLHLHEHPLVTAAEIAGYRPPAAAIHCEPRSLLKRLFGMRGR